MKVEVSFEDEFIPIGDKDANIVLVTDRPFDAKENMWMKGTHFRLLDSMLSEVGIDAYTCYKTCVTKEDVHSFSVKYDSKSPKPILRREWNDLIEEIKEVNPNVVIALGKEPLRALMKNPTLSEHNYRGSILSTEVGKVIPTFEPSYIMKMFEKNPIMLFDLQRAKEQSETEELNRRDRNLVTDPNFSEIMNFLEYCHKQDKISFDIETFKGGTDRYQYIDCIGIAPSPDYAMCIPFCKANGKSIWSLEEEIKIYLAVSELLRDSSVKKIAQNAQFDICHVEDFGMPVTNLFFDTMNAAKVIEPEFPKGLDFLASIYTEEPYFKDEMKENRWLYNAKDAAITFEVHEGQIQDLKEKGLYDFYFEHVHPLIRVFIDVSRQGVKADQELMNNLDDRLTKEIEEKRKRLKELTGKEINVYSVKDMREYIYNDLGLNPRYNDNGNLDTSKESLKEFYRRTGREEFKIMMDLRKERSTVSSFTSVDVSEDGRIRTSYLVSGTDSGRLASKKYVDGTGMNLQNRKKGIMREIFIPDDGFMFMGADLGQAENRVVAYASNDENMIKVVESEGDVHRENAGMIFGKPAEEITDEERQLGKRITHANNYMMGVGLFSKLANISYEEARELQSTYFNTYPRVKMWHKEIEIQIRTTRVLENPFGRKRTFYGRLKDSTFRSAVSYIPQSTVADKLHSATHEIRARLPYPARIVMQLHDEIFIQCLPEQEKECKQILEDALTRPFVLNGYEVSIPTEVKTGNNWNEVS